MAGWRTRNPFRAFDRLERFCRTRHTADGGTEFGLTLPQHNVAEPGTDHPPRLAIALAGTINETLGRVVQSGCPSVFYFANACPWLVARGWCEHNHRFHLHTHTAHLDLLENDSYGRSARRACASLDLPSHGKQLLPGEPAGGIIGWRWRMDRGIDFVEQSQRRLEDMVSYLAKHNLANTDGVFIAGISRGGFLAAQYAARATPTRVAAVGLLSPVTNLSLLSEFADENATMQVGIGHCTALSHCTWLQ